MSFEGKQLVRTTISGAHHVAGCVIRRVFTSWVVTCGQSYVGECDSFVEAEACAKREGVRVREKVAKLEAEAAERQAERQAEGAAEQLIMGARVGGFDPEPIDEADYSVTEFDPMDDVTPIRGRLPDGTSYDM